MPEAGAYRRPWNVLFYYTGSFRDGTVTGAEIAEAEFLKAIVACRLFRRLQIVSKLPDLQQQRLADFLQIVDRRDVKLDSIRNLRSLVKAAPPDLALCPYVFQFQLDPLRAEQAFPIAGYVHTISTLDAKSGLARNLRMPDHHLDVALCPTPSVERGLKAIAAELPGFERSPVPTRIVPLGLDASFVRPAEEAERERLRAALGVGPEEAVFLYVGRLSPWTKMDLLPLLDAFALASARTPAALRLFIVGQEQASGYADILKERSRQLGIGDKVVIKDRIGREELPAIYNASDAFVSPSDNRQETFGLTLVEAMAAGLPVIAADWNGYADVLGRDGGLLIPSLAVKGDEELVSDLYYRGILEIAAQMSQATAISITHLADAMAAVAEDRAFRQRLARSARERFLTHFRWQSVFESLVKIWEEQVAAAERWRSLALSRPQPELSLNLDACFGHYPSRRWSDEARLRPARRSTADHDLLLTSLARVSNIDWARCLELRSQVEAGESSTLAELLGPGESPAAARRCIAFLIKHGLLEVEWDALLPNPAREADDALSGFAAMGEERTVQAGMAR